MRIKISLFIRVICLFCLIFRAETACHGQNGGLGSWNILNLKYTLNEKWALFGEAQLRSLKFYHDFHYYEIKGGADFRITPIVKLTLGAGTYQTYQEGGNFVLPKNNDEFRIWPQISLYQSVGIVKIEHRYRMECRFTSDGYRNRFRYRLGVSIPFGRNSKGFDPLQINVSDELFFTDQGPYFERNRFLLALNYKFSASFMLQTGYLHQFDYKIHDETGRDFFILGFFFDIFRKKNTETRNNAESKDQ